MSGIKLIDRGKGSELLRKYCREHDVPVDLVRALVDMEVKHQGRARRHGLNAEIDELLSRAIEDSRNVP
jgi:hypothetical protein